MLEIISNLCFDIQKVKYSILSLMLTAEFGKLSLFMRIKEKKNINKEIGENHQYLQFIILF